MVLSLNTLFYAIIIILLFFVMYVLFITLLSIFINKIYFDKRMGISKYYKNIEYTHFENLKKDEFSFMSGKNKLNGGLYYYPNNNNKIIIFMHGFGPNHKDYLYEINYFAELGYKVYAFDATATGISEGKKFKGAPQLLIDLNYCIEEVNKLNNNSGIILVGHSMGAYAVSNITRFKNVKKVIAIAPFDNITDIVDYNVRKKLGRSFILFKIIFKLIQLIKFKKYANIKTFETYHFSKTPILVIQGKEDDIVKADDFIENMNINNNRYVNYLLLEEKKHRPLLSKDAIFYNYHLSHQIDNLNFKYGKNISKEIIDDFNKQINYDLKNEFDINVLKTIELFLKEE